MPFHPAGRTHSTYILWVFDPVSISVPVSHTFSHLPGLSCLAVCRLFSLQVALSFPFLLSSTLFLCAFCATFVILARNRSPPPTVRRITRFLLTVSGRQPFPLFLSAFFGCGKCKEWQTKAHTLPCVQARFLAAPYAALLLHWTHYCSTYWSAELFLSFAGLLPVNWESCSICFSPLFSFFVLFLVLLIFFIWDYYNFLLKSNCSTAQHTYFCYGAE